MVTIPDVTVPKNALSFGAGYLYWASFGGASLPANTVVGSVFTDAWPAGWNLLGVTREGHEFSYEINVDTVEAAEYLDPLQYVTTGRAAGMSFDLMQVHATNFRRALNAAAPSTTGSGTTLLTTLTPPAPGDELRCMIGWESVDNTERMVAEQAFQTGTLTINRRKGADNASIPVEYRFEVPASGNPFVYYAAGTLRA